MRLAKLSAFRRLVYAEGSAPSLATLRARIESIPGGRIEHGHYYVDLDEYERVNGLRASLEARQKTLRSELRELM